jgi:hypothetical protein
VALRVAQAVSLLREETAHSVNDGMLLLRQDEIKEFQYAGRRELLSHLSVDKTAILLLLSNQMLELLLGPE